MQTQSSPYFREVFDLLFEKLCVCALMLLHSWVVVRKHLHPGDVVPLLLIPFQTLSVFASGIKSQHLSKRLETEV